MMRHGSMFRLKPEYRIPEVIGQIESQLWLLPEKLPSITDCEIGVKPVAMPAESPDGHVRFYDLIQIITFAAPKDCADYPASAAHQEFLASSSEYMEQVVGIDYEV